MNYTELLDLAGKAQGWVDYPQDSIEQGAYWHTDLARAPFGPTFPKSGWKPHLDDGDCARMEAALGIDVEWFPRWVLCQSGNVSPVGGHYSDHSGDRNAARRLASLRVAAAIGKAQQC